MARPCDGQQVPLHGTADRLVPESDRPISFDDEPVLDRLGESCPDICVEDTVAVAGSTRGARRRTVRLGLVCVGDIGELLGRQRETRRRHQAQDSPTLAASVPRVGR